MLFNSILTGLRGQVAMQKKSSRCATNWPCFNELTNRGAFCSIGRIVAFGFGCHGCGRVGVPLSSSSSLKPSSAGIIKDSDGIGLGRFVMGGLDDLAFRRKRAISSGQ